ncbi:MAG: class I SAM-dependent methyltransferase [Cyanobacteria bacterium]|nr:class I SAM-dependent methyltransferase [Cyanobacteriota bacterium]
MGWSEFIAHTKNAKAHTTLLYALELFEKEGFECGQAVDLGCGAGSDTYELMDRGWRVHAVDQEQSALRSIIVSIERARMKQLTVCLSTFEKATWPDDVDLINASYSLPFCSKDHFAPFWRRLVNSIRTGGRFSGHFFGPRDDWANSAKTLHFNETELRLLFRKMDIELLNEVEDERITIEGTEKHWHLWEIVARKR